MGATNDFVIQSVSPPLGGSTILTAQIQVDDVTNANFLFQWWLVVVVEAFFNYFWMTSMFFVT